MPGIRSSGTSNRGRGNHRAVGRYLIRRTLTAIPTLLAISFVIFALLDLAPGDPTSQYPETVSPEEREAIREALGANGPFLVRYGSWLRQLAIDEPMALLDEMLGREGNNRTRLISWSSRSPLMDTIAERLPQTLWVLGTAFIIAILIALPIGIVSAYRQYSVVDQVGTLVSMLGYSVPTFLTGLIAILIFSDGLGWPSFYDTTHRVTDWASFVFQLKQIAMPVAVLALFNAASLSRYTRSAMLENLNQEYIRTARSKGARERRVVILHAFRNSCIPIVTLIALQLPGIFAGAIITEQVFRINGIGQALISAIEASDIPMVQTLTFLFAVLVVASNLLADMVYGWLDPRIRYDS
jgi:peptide/nickel transport system permease protein